MSTGNVNVPAAGITAAAVDPALPRPGADAVALRASRGGRVLALLMAIAGSGVLSLAAWLNAAPEGLGTHEQLRLPTCGWIRLMDVPCPTCGMTTAFAHAADGNLVASFLAQPLGCLLAIATAMGVIIGVYVTITGSRVLGLLGRLWGRRTGWLLAGIVVTAWGYKVLSYRGLL